MISIAIAHRIPRALARTMPALAVVALAIPACGGEPPAVVRTMVVDSAGVVTVTSNPLNSDRRCTAGDEPTFHVGDAASDDRYQFYGVRGVARLSDGSVAIADRGTKSVRIFGSTAEYVRSMGREGEGPGEFRDPLSIWALPGDTLWVGNSRPWYFNVFTAAGEFVRLVRPNPAYANPSRGGGVLSNGSSVNVRVEGEGEDYRTPQDVFVDAHARDGELIGTLMALEGRRFGPPTGPINFVLDPLFEAMPSVDASGATVAVANGRDPEVRLLDDEFWLRRSIRWPDSDRNVTAAHVNAWREDYLERRGADGARSPVTDLLVSEDRPVADRFPTVSGIVVGRDGRIWVRRYPRPRETTGWLVFEPEGDFLCHFEPVPGLQVYEFGPDYILGSRRDALDIESVVMYELMVPAPP